VRALFWARRLRNGIKKLAAGLRPFGESVWPGVKNDLFVAHESIYLYFASLVAGRRVLDAGCGTGYGSALLARSGAASVLAVDIDRFSIRYARRRYSAPNLTFLTADCERLDLPEASLDVIVSSNVLEHLDRPERFLALAADALTAGGRLVVALPPITYAAALEQHERIRYHRSNLSVDGWLELFARCGWSVAVLAHRYAPEPALPDFRSLEPSRLSAGDFTVLPSHRNAVYAEPPITVVYALARERPG
jgi:SAM-dependent methyltransferase